MAWFARNTDNIEAGAAIVTALVAALALVGVKWQIDMAQQRELEQGARDLYREHLALSMQYPQYSAPGACPSFSAQEETAYDAYVTHLIYTAEETSAAHPSWGPVMAQALAPHAAFICDSLGEQMSVTNSVNAMLAKIAVTACADLPVCSK